MECGSKKEKEYIKAVYCHPAYLTYMQSPSGFPGGSDGKASACNAGDPGSIPGSGRSQHKLESRLLGEISITSDMQMTPPLWQKVKKN